MLIVPKNARALKMLLEAADSHQSSAPEKIARDHFIRENVALSSLDKRREKGAFFSKKCVFFTVSRLRSENAVLGGIVFI